MTDRNPKEPEVSKTCTTCKYDALPAHAPECQGCSVMGWSNPEEKWTPKDPEADPVNNPAHYTKGIETYQYISSWGMGFAQGNAIKYLTRYQDKGKPLEDLKKARWYLDQLIKAEEAKL